MLLTELILSKRGPLAKVWLSAHHERKLSKQQALGVDVEESVDAILTQEDGPIALRLSGQLMLGVTRIYSRKVQYLLDDCKETRERISLAFRPGIVDLPEDQIRANKNAITFTDIQTDFDFFDWSWAAPPPEIAVRGRNTASAAQINLRPSREFGAYNFGRPRASSIYGDSSTSRHGSQDLETSSHLDSRDFSGIDLNLGLDDSIEYGRNAQQALNSREGSLASGRRIRGSSLGMGSIRDADPIDISFEPVDLGLDFGDVEQPGLENRFRRESSALSTPPPVSPNGVLDLTAEVAPAVDAQERVPMKAKRLRLLQADEELELPDEDFAAPNRDNSKLLGEERYIPSDPEVIRLQEIIANPGAHFLPTIKVGGESMIFAGPYGLAPELAELFTFPTNILRRDRSAGLEDDRAAKRARLEGDEEDELEIARRGSMAPASDRDYGNVFGPGDDTFEIPPPGEDDLQFQPGGDDIPFGAELTPRAKRVGRADTREPSLAPSRAESMARAVQFGEAEIGDHALSMFDPRTRSEADRESQLTQTPTKSDVSRTSSGYSRNTVMAMGLLRRELEAIEDEDKVLQFEKVAQRATKKAASAFFFELLVLGNRDAVKLEQPRAFQDISIRGKDKLWAEITA